MYWDFSTTPAAVFSKAVTYFPKTKMINGKSCTLSTVRVVQRFVTVVYLDGKPVRTVHWTSTFEGFPGMEADPRNIRTTIIGEFEGGQGTSGYANKVISDWENGPDEE